MRKLQKTTLQDRRESRSIEIAFNLINQSGYRLTFTALKLTDVKKPFPRKFGS